MGAAPPGSRARGPGRRRRREAQGEVTGRDGGREAIVERLGDAQAGVHRVPARVLDRPLVQPQAAGVEEPEQVDRAEVALAQRPVLVRAVLAHVPRVARALGALGGEREDVGRGDVGDAGRADQLPHVGHHGVRVLDVLDRLQEHHAVDVAGPDLEHVAFEAHPAVRVLQARVLERLRVGVDAHDRGGRAGERRGSVALAAGEIDDPPPVRAGGDPLVDRQMAPEPVVLLRHVRQRALAGERQRRHALRLVALDVELHRRGHHSGQPVWTEWCKTCADKTISVAATWMAHPTSGCAHW